ncbi:MAG: D-amino acid dehydrogenase [Gammaproteobacteria bacterium]
MEVCVIGAGLLGLSTAYRLAELGCSVCVIDRNNGVGLETSFANGSMLHASQANPWNEPGILGAAVKMLGKEDAALLIRAKALPRMMTWGLEFVRQSRPECYATNIGKNARLARYSIAVIGEMRAALDLQYKHNSCGTAKVFRSESGFEHARSFIGQIEDLDIPYELLNVEQLVALEPALAPIQRDLKGGMFFPSDEVGDAYEYCVALQRACEDLGVQFLFDVEVTHLEKGRTKIRAAVHEKGQVAADLFAIACGSYSPGLVRRLGIKLPIQPVKGYSITTPVDSWQTPPHVAVIDEDMHAAVCPLGDNLRVAGTAEFAGFDKSLTPSRINNLVALLRNLYPEYTPHLDEQKIQGWAGLRPMTPDGVGIMGATKLPNLFINSGHGHLGWTMAAGAGRALADLMINGKGEIDIEQYGLGRFS